MAEYPVKELGGCSIAVKNDVGIAIRLNHNIAALERRALIVIEAGRFGCHQDSCAVADKV